MSNSNAYSGAISNGGMSWVLQEWKASVSRNRKTLKKKKKNINPRTYLCISACSKNTGKLSLILVLISQGIVFHPAQTQWSSLGLRAKKKTERELEKEREREREREEKSSGRESGAWKWREAKPNKVVSTVLLAWLTLGRKHVLDCVWHAGCLVVYDELEALRTYQPHRAVLAHGCCLAPRKKQKGRNERSLSLSLSLSLSVSLSLLFEFDRKCLEISRALEIRSRLWLSKEREREEEEEEEEEESAPFQSPWAFSGISTTSAAAAADDDDDDSRPVTLPKFLLLICFICFTCSLASPVREEEEEEEEKSDDEIVEHFLSFSLFYCILFYKINRPQEWLCWGCC